VKERETMDILEVHPHLYRIPLSQNIKGFGNFIGSWVFRGDVNFIVDVGPKSSAELLLEGLNLLTVNRLDFVFLTHVHIDHAGALASLIARFPEAKVICHPSGVRHLVEPENLWEGSQKVLGELALKFGKMDPVPARHLMSFEAFEREGFQIIDTPGHAPHHMSLVHGSSLFVGEAAGIFLDLDGEPYLRPATPPRFFLPETVQSIDRLLEADVQEIFYAHSGNHPDARKMLKRYRDQLFFWRDVIAEQMQDPRKEHWVDRCVAALFERDECLRGLRTLGQDEKEREFYFARNSIQGFIQYLGSG
jgi:glyoxylase-like metal-dependent hydrolase (beta-lactamase superfamily II)